MAVCDADADDDNDNNDDGVSPFRRFSEMLPCAVAATCLRVGVDDVAVDGLGPVRGVAVEDDGVDTGFLSRVTRPVRTPFMICCKWP